MTEEEAKLKANETARKIVGDYVVLMVGYPSTRSYEALRGVELVKVIEKELYDSYSRGVHDGINEG